jgi:cobalt-zinc-cadmium efflux system membrane fusion protein
MKRISGKLSALFFTVLLILAPGCGRSESDQHSASESSSGPDTVRVRVEALASGGLSLYKVGSRVMMDTLTIPSRIIPSQDLEANVGSLIQGRVREVFVKLGDRVKKNQPLMTLEGLEIGELKARYVQATANLKYAETKYNRAKSLFEQNAASQKLLLEARADFEKARAEFSAEDQKIHSVGMDDQELLAIAEGKAALHSSGFMALRSPIDGVISERNVSIGQFVEPNSNAFKIVDTRELWVDGNLSEIDLSRVSVNTRVALRVAAYPLEVFRGTIVYVGTTVDAQSRSIKVRATVLNSDRKLRPEMFAEMLIPERREALGFVIPSECVVKDGEESFVFKSIGEGAFLRQSVRLGEVRSASVVVLDGIIVGDNLVQNGTFIMKSEMKKGTFGGGE